MFSNYIRVAWRNIVKHRFYSGVNGAGLSMGIGFTLLIAAYAWRELQVNHSLRNADRQYIIQSKWKGSSVPLEITTLAPLAKALREQYPTLVANYCRWDGISSNVSKGDKVFRESIQIVDNTMLPMYGFRLLHGNARTALGGPYSLVISQRQAQKYFGSTDVEGRTLTIESFSGTRREFMITGVMEQPADNSVTHINDANSNGIYVGAEAVAYFGRNLDKWDNPNIVSYIELQPGVSPAALTAPIRNLLQNNATPQTSADLTPVPVALQDFYLSKDKGLVRKMLYTVLVIAGFILLMAVINFINVSVARAASRMREIGVRKVMGGRRHQLVTQFLVESVLLSFASALAGVLLYAAGNAPLSAALGKKIPALPDLPLAFLAVPAALALLVGLLAGLYPALVLSGLKAADSVKGKLQSVGQNVLLRKFLVGFQFCTAAVVLTGAIVITKQVALFFSNDLGYDKDLIVSSQVPRNWSTEGVSHMRAVRDELATVPGVSQVSLAFEIPNGNNSGVLPVYAEGKDSASAVVSDLLMTDDHYLDVYHVPTVAGRFFSQPSDSGSIVINESAVAALGWKVDEAPGKKLYLPGAVPLNVIGVVKDFHFGSMKDRIGPASMLNVSLTKTYRFLSFKLKPGDIAGTIAAIRAKWATLLPGSAFEYRFMDDALAEIYSAEIRLRKASRIATALSLLIVMLGVIGLVSLSVQRRVKEIGIRKVLGASLPGIARLFLREFIPVMIGGAAVAVPIASIIMQYWLNDYSYRVALTPWPFIMAAAGLALITVILITVQILRAASARPVRSLRSE